MFPTRATRVLQQAYVVSMQLAFMSTQLAMHQPLPHRGTATASDELPAGSARALPLHVSESQEEFGNGLRRIACGLSSCSTTTSGTATASDELPAGSACALPLQASEPQEEFGNGLRRIACGLGSCSTTTRVRVPGGVRQRPQTNCLRAQLVLYHYKRQSPRRSLELIRCALEYQ